MAGSLLIPVSVTAKVIGATTQVPELRGTPFTRQAVLEPGIHVHWALPDALTRARILKTKAGDRTIFPGVPDLWVVVRLNPIPASPTVKYKRAWSGWVVDSRTQSVTKLQQWTAPDTKASKEVHTVAGLLPSAAALGFPAWGMWPADRDDFDPAMAAYYPECRKRFGLYDSTADLAKTGKVSYVAVGWYSDRVHDPLYNAKDRAELLRRWKLAHHSRSNHLRELATEIATTGLIASAAGAQPVVARPIATQPTPTRPTVQPAPGSISVGAIGAAAAALAQWKPASLTTTVVTAPAEAGMRAMAREATRGGAPTDGARQMMELQKKVTTAAQAGVATQVLSRGIVQVTGPTEIICHGAVVEVPLAAGAAAAALGEDQVHLYPSASRAAAVIAALDQSAGNIDSVEMLLDDLDHQSGTIAGVLDLPGAAHARSFQSIPGESRWFARLEVRPPLSRLVSPAAFEVLDAAPQLGRMAAGHWPPMPTRSKQISQNETLAQIPDVLIHQFEPAAPTGPTGPELDAAIAKFRTALSAAVVAAAAAGTPIHPRLVRVQDYRKKAQMPAIGRTADGSGTDSSATWLVVPAENEDDSMLREFFKAADGARVALPSATNLYEQPGPRWYRPWSPQVVLYDTGRTQRFGEDGRYDRNQFVKCRYSGETLSAIGIGTGPVVTGRDALNAPGPLANAGLPSEVAALVEEGLLLDSDSGPALATHASGTGAPSGSQLRNGIRAIWMSRMPALSAQQTKAIKAVKKVGDTPSPIAVTPWTDPRDPMFLDANYAHLQWPIAASWQLLRDSVEMTRTIASGNTPPAGVIVQNERSKVTASLVKVLDSSLVSKMTLDVHGNPKPAHTPPGGMDEDAFKNVDIVSAPLTRFDEQLVSPSGVRERAGALRLNKIDLVDGFGLVRSWKTNLAESSPTLTETTKYWTALTPRLPYWSRLNFRMQAAGGVNEEASVLAPPVCGFLLPDFIEHSLEVFDGRGQPLGQLVGDRAQSGNPGAAKTLKVRFETHPWVMTGGNPLDAITDPVLRSIVAGLVAQETAVPAAAAQGLWFETGLTAFMRVIDTIRATLDPTKKTHDRKIRLLGEPIVVFSATLTLQGSASNQITDYRKAVPPLLQAPPAMPQIHVRIGDVTRPDDGVLGCFLPGVAPADARFAPVSREAAEKAVLNGLAWGVASTQQAATHVFVQNLETDFVVPFNQPLTLAILADPSGGIYATCGALPRKKLTMPREFVEPGLRALEATFRTGPVLALPAKVDVTPAVAAVDIQGYRTEFVRKPPLASEFVEVAVPETVPVGELPLKRAVLTEGWLRVYQAKNP